MEKTHTLSNNVLFLSNLPRTITKSELEDLLIPSGPLVSVNVVHKTGYAFAFAEF